MEPSSRLIKFLVALCIVISAWKVAFITKHNMVTGDEHMYTSPAYNLIRYGDPGVKEYGEIAYYGEEYYFAGKLLIYFQAMVYSVFGYTIETMKIIPFLFYLVTGFLLYRMLSRLFDRNSAIIAAAIWFLLPTFIYRIIARPEAMQLCAMVLSIHYFVIVRDTPTKLKLFICGLLSCVGLWIHPTTFFVGAAAITLLALFNLNIKQALYVIWGQACMGLGFGIYLFAIWDKFWVQFYEAGLVWMDANLLVSENPFLYRFSRELNKLYNFFARPYVLPFTITLLVAFMYTVKKHSKLYFRFILPLLPGALMASFMSAHSAKSIFYYIYLMPAIFVVFTLFISELTDRKPFLPFLTLLLAYFVVSQVAITYKRRDTDFRELAEKIRSEIDTDKVILGTEPYNIIYKSPNYLGSFYYTFWKSITDDEELKKKYRYFYGDSFHEFMKKQEVKYVILDRNNQAMEELEEEIRDISEIVFEEKSEYGMWKNSFVRVYAIKGLMD